MHNHKKNQFLVTMLDVKKTNYYSFSEKPTKTNDIPLVLPKLNINNREFIRTESKFLAVFLDDSLSRKPHIKNMEKNCKKHWSINQSKAILK